MTREDALFELRAMRDAAAQRAIQQGRTFAGPHAWDANKRDALDFALAALPSEPPADLVPRCKMRHRMDGAIWICTQPVDHDGPHRSGSHREWPAALLSEPPALVQRVPGRSDGTPLGRAWLRLNGFYVMGGFSVDTLPESHRAAFRDAQRDFVDALKGASDGDQ